MVAHVDPLPREKAHFIVRVFREPVGEIDTETGQPWKKYDGMCILSVSDGIGELQGLMNVPIEGFFVIRGEVAKQLGLREIFGYRWENGTKRRVVLPIRRL